MAYELVAFFTCGTLLASKPSTMAGRYCAKLVLPCVRGALSSVSTALLLCIPDSKSMSVGIYQKLCCVARWILRGGPGGRLTVEWLRWSLTRPCMAGGGEGDPGLIVELCTLGLHSIVSLLGECDRGEA